jgi:hypothetical protein
LELVADGGLHSESYRIKISLQNMNTHATGGSKNRA